MDCAFTEVHYRQIILSFLTAGYRFSGYADADLDAARCIILRHDVDLSINDALRIARLDAELGITSSFHFLLTAEIYNMKSRIGQAAVREIRGMGHSIGLHVDLAALAGGDSCSRDFYSELEKLFTLAKTVIGPLDSYSIHRPAIIGNFDQVLPERVGFSVPCFADADKYRRNMLYRSDSRRQWRHGCICGQIDALAGGSVQLVLHPIWWSPQVCTREELLESLVNRNENADEYLASNLSFYDRIL